MLLGKWLSAYRKFIVDSCLPSCASINSKWIKDLNIIPKNFALVEEKPVNILEAICIGNYFLSRTPAA
jgi:hypothetical protein